MNGFLQHAQEIQGNSNIDIQTASHYFHLTISTPISAALPFTIGWQWSHHREPLADGSRMLDSNADLSARNQV